MTHRRKPRRECKRCGARVIKPGADMCHHCNRQANTSTVDAERAEAMDAEPTTLPPITAEKLIEQWGRA